MGFVLTPQAVRFIARLLRFDGGPGHGLSLQVTPGGCSGLSASFQVEAAPAPGEVAVEQDGVRLFLDAEARLLLEGATIDFAESPTSSGFVFHTPSKACGCGSGEAGALPTVRLVGID